MPVVSIVVATCRRNSDLRECLNALQLQAQIVSKCEVIVTDDGEVADTQHELGHLFPRVVWTQGPQQGPAANRNHGARRASGDWILFLDDDLIPQPNFVAALLDATATSKSESVFEGPIVNDRARPNLLWEAPFNEVAVPYLTCSAAFCIRRSAFELVGGFDERYKAGVYAEDMDFSAKLVARGLLKGFVPNAVVVHPLRAVPSAEKLARRWEGKVIYALDQSASSFRVLWNLPWHSLRVIQSRFAGQPCTWQNAKASQLFFREWLWVVRLTPGWVLKWSKRPRSKFWQEHVARHGAVPKFGF